MDRSDSPPSPLHSPESPPRSVQSQTNSSKRSHKSSKDRPKSNLASRSKELVRLLVHEEHESHELRSMVQVLSERLSNESTRADTAEARAKEAVLRFKQVNDARLAAQQQASRANEELALYKLQLDNAQREIRRAQELLDALEAQRFEAEESAARARSTARKLKEEKIVQLARDEGRLQGMKEGMARGRMLGYEEGRAEGYARGRTASSRDGSQNDSPPINIPSTGDYNFRNIVPRSDSTDDKSPPPPDYSIPPAEKIIIHSPPAEPLRQSPSRMQDSEIHPIPVHNIPSSPQHSPMDFPPEGWVPTIEGDRIRLPPPHELSPSPFSPSLTPSHTPPPTHYLPHGVPEDSPALMIPPPSRRTTLETVPDNDSVTSNEYSGRPRMLMRRRSSDSQSTTFSQFDLVSPPTAPSARTNVSHRPNVLSAIVEESTPATSPAYIPAPSLRVPSPVMIPTPEAPMPILPRAPQQDYYRRPGSSSSQESSVRRIPSRNQLQPSLSSPKGSVSDAGVNIIVEAPSRPESSRSGFFPAEQGMLSAGDAERPPDTAPQQEPAPLPVRLADGHLPPGFVPIGGPITIPQTTPQASGATPAIYGLYTPAGASGRGADVPQSTEPVVVPLPATGAKRYSRTALQHESSTSESDSRPVSSDMSSSSMDSFTTPPQRRKTIPPSSYAAAPTPPNITYPLPQSRPSTSRTSSAPKVPMAGSTADSPPMSTVTAARVPLPASSVGSPRSAYTKASKRGGSTTAGPISQVTSPLMVPTRNME